MTPQRSGKGCKRRDVACMHGTQAVACRCLTRTTSESCQTGQPSAKTPADQLFQVTIDLHFLCQGLSGGQEDSDTSVDPGVVTWLDKKGQLLNSAIKGFPAGL